MVWEREEGRLVRKVLTNCTPAQCRGGHLDLKSWWLWQGSSFHFLEFSLFYFLTWVKKGQPVFRKEIQKLVRSHNISLSSEFVMIQRVPAETLGKIHMGKWAFQSPLNASSIIHLHGSLFIALHILPLLRGGSGLMFGCAGFYGERHISIMSSHMTRK